jgi:Ca2+/H+ antiporter
MFHAFGSGGDIKQETRLSTGISLIFLCAYIFMLFFQLKTHKDFFGSDEEEESGGKKDANTNTSNENTPLLNSSRHSKASPVQSITPRSKSSPRYSPTIDEKENVDDGNDLESQEYRPPLVVPLTSAGAERVHRSMIGRTFSNVRHSLSRENLIEHIKHHKEDSEDLQEESWSVRTAMIMLVLSTIGVVILSEILTGVVEIAGDKMGIGEVFMGVIVIAIVGNAAEHFTAVTSAMHDKMDISIGIAFGSALQIAMFVVPVIILVSHLRPAELGPMNLTLTEFEVFSVTVSVVISWMIVQDGLANWLEGVMLLIIYLILALAFFFSQDVDHPAKSAPVL